MRNKWDWSMYGDIKQPNKENKESRKLTQNTNTDRKMRSFVILADSRHSSLFRKLRAYDVD